MKKCVKLITAILTAASISSCEPKPDPSVQVNEERHTTAENFPKHEKVTSDPVPPQGPLNPAGLDLVDSFVLAYDRDSIPQFVDNNTSIRGLYIDSKLIDLLRDPNYKDINGIYLYFARRIKDRKIQIDPNDRYNDGKYTLFAIPSMPTKIAPIKDSLLVSKSFEWHDPISSHQPINEHEIGY